MMLKSGNRPLSPAKDGTKDNESLLVKKKPKKQKQKTIQSYQSEMMEEKIVPCASLSCKMFSRPFSDWLIKY